MRVRDGELPSLSAAIVTALLAKGFVRTTHDRGVLQQRIVQLIARNLDEEADLEAEAERLAERHARQLVGMDHHKIIQGIKERLARERGFSL